MREWIQEEHREQKMYAGADGEAIPEEFREARNKGLYYLQFSGKTENEMRKKLAEQEFSPASVEDAILFLKHYRYLDDEDYARRYVEKNGHKKSIRQMKFDLRQKGVSDDLVEMIFEDMEVDESAQILGLLRKKNYDPEEPDPAKRQKIYAFLARKGFSYDAINRNCSAAFQRLREPADCSSTTFVGMHRSPRNAGIILDIMHKTV